ncbi:MAG: ribonuclease E activity regulator RraA [Chitinophagales bacterium]|nr:ribonuclease E activity regulator RraA [Chitinophagales bacterium]
MSLKTTDLSDLHPKKVQAADSLFRDFGGRKMFHGEIVTLKIFEDNSLVRKALEQNGEGKVLVIDGGGSLRCALLGDQLGELAVKNKWNGVLVFGCVRDSEALSQLDLGIKALNTHPLKTEKRNEGQENITVRFAGVDFVPGTFIYADEDGVLVTSERLH